MTCIKRHTWANTIHEHQVITLMIILFFELNAATSNPQIECENHDNHTHLSFQIHALHMKIALSRSCIWNIPSIQATTSCIQLQFNASFFVFYFELATCSIDFDFSCFCDHKVSTLDLKGWISNLWIMSMFNIILGYHSQQNLIFVK